MIWGFREGTRIVRDPAGREMLISSRTTTGSMSRDKVNAWERCSVWIAASFVGNGILSVIVVDSECTKNR